MTNRVQALIVLLAANALGLIVAAVLFDRMDLDALSFVVVVAIFSVALALTIPLVRKVVETKAPALAGGLTVMATFLSLLVTELISDGLEIEGIGTWFGATLVVWAFTMLAGYALPKIFLEKRTTGL
jgi:hypothetical protein